MVFKKKKKTNRPKYTKYSSYRRSDTRKFKPKKESRVNRMVFSKRFRFVRKALFFLGLIVLLSFTVYYVFFSGSIKVEETALFEGKVRIDHDIILSEINAYKGEPLLSINKAELTKELKAKYPEIDQIVIKKKLPNRLHVHITKYPITANLIVKVEEVQRKYLINQRGMIALADAEDSSLPYITMQRDKAYNSKEQIMTEEELSKIIKAKKLFEQKFNMLVTDVIYLEKAREFRLKTEKGFMIWLDLTQDYVSQLSKLKAAEQKLNIHSTPLEYIDLRIAGSNGEKVIFKRK